MLSFCLYYKHKYQRENNNSNNDFGSSNGNNNTTTAITFSNHKMREKSTHQKKISKSEIKYEPNVRKRYIDDINERRERADSLLSVEQKKKQKQKIASKPASTVIN